jgi:hypothetical protein
MQKLLKLILLLIFAILSISYTEELLLILRQKQFLLYGEARWLLIGAGIYIPIHIIFRRLILLHVFGHEITHAIWSMMFGGKIKEIYVSGQSGGFTTFTKGNILVYIAPYFFPLYTIILTLVYLLAKEAYKEIFLVLIGLSIAFHLLLTLYSIRKGQSDIKQVGVIFSLVFIYLMNCLVLGTILCVIFKDLSTLDYLSGGLANVPCTLKVIREWTEGLLMRGS